MSMFRLLFLLFLIIPLIEISILIQVGGMIGVMPTVVLCVLTAVVGAGLLRYQGLQTMVNVQTKLSQGKIPAIDMLGGILLLLSGALLLTPGFFTDGIGFLCLVPQFRSAMAANFLTHMLQKEAFHEVKRSVNVTVDGEYWEEDKRRIDD